MHGTEWSYTNVKKGCGPYLCVKCSKSSILTEMFWKAQFGTLLIRFFGEFTALRCLTRNLVWKKVWHWKETAVRRQWYLLMYSERRDKDWSSRPHLTPVKYGSQSVSRTTNSQVRSNCHCVSSDLQTKTLSR